MWRMSRLPEEAISGAGHHSALCFLRDTFNKASPHSDSDNRLLIIERLLSQSFWGGVLVIHSVQQPRIYGTLIFSGGGSL